MNEIISLLHKNISENNYQDIRDSVSAVLPEGLDVSLGGAWIDGREMGLEQDPEDNVIHGICQITVTGAEAMDPELVERIAAMGEREACDVLRHPQGEWQGIAIMVDGARVWIEGLAAELFGGNVFDCAFEGHPASLNFVARVTAMLGSETNLLLEAVNNPDKRPELRTLLEERVGISFADDQLYYGKGDDGLGNVYSASMLGMEPEAK